MDLCKCWWGELLTFFDLYIALTCWCSVCVAGRNVELRAFYDGSNRRKHQVHNHTVSAGVGNQLYFADLYMKLAFCFVQSIYLLRCWFAPPFSLSAIAFIPKGRGSEGRYHADSSCGYYYRSCGIVDQSCPLLKWICILPSPFLLCFVSVPGRHLLISGGRRLFPILVRLQVIAESTGAK